MKYEITKELETGNRIIDNEHRELFRMINTLQEACTIGKGREHITQSVNFLLDYVNKHFRNEDALQSQAKYPEMQTHHQFHEGYKMQLAAAAKELLETNASIASLVKLNQLIATLISHIKIEDKKLAAFLHSRGK